MTKFDKLLSGGDLRSIGQTNMVVSKIQNQVDFDEFFKCLFHNDRIIVMRAADAIEKITLKNPVFLKNHKTEILKLSQTAGNKELKWHLALLIPRLNINKKELGKVWATLSEWAKDKANSRIVRVNSIQALFELTKQEPMLITDFKLNLDEVAKENIPSIDARIKKIKMNSSY